MAKIEISDEAYKELKNNLGDQKIENFASLMICSGVYHWKELMAQLPDEF
jgi:hypothetical protein